MKRGKIPVLACAMLLGLVPFTGCSRGASLHTAPMLEAPVEERLPEPSPPEAVLPEAPPSEPPTEEPKEMPKTAHYVQVLVNGLNIRAGAGLSFPVLGQAERGVLLKRGERTNDWYETEYCGRTAFVSADARYTRETELEAGDARTENVIAAGLLCLGTPYVYGAVRLHDGRGNFNRDFTETAFDCSSLMQYIFYKGGDMLLDVTTRTQIVQGERVPERDIRRGDLLFFTNASRCGRTGIERVGHVALYLGDNYILHTASDYAKIEQISEKRRSYFLEARRLL